MILRFVIPWYGENIPGGAELACRLTAENLNKNGLEVEVLTTCAKDCYNWGNFHKPGTTIINGVKVKRFKADKRDALKFDSVNKKLMQNIPINRTEETDFVNEMIHSSTLYDYIKKNESLYFFIPYMFGTTIRGSLIRPESSFLIPCLHDESYAYLNAFKEIFSKVKGMIYLSNSEQKFANKIYDIQEKQQKLFGLGVEIDTEPSPQRFRNKYKINDDFIIYVGRKEIGKNVPLLIEYFSKYKDYTKCETKLILVGGGNIDIPQNRKKDIVDLGFIPQIDKHDAFSAALLHCQPSVNESFSFSIMESWLCKKPVLVHEDCQVTKDHCLKSNGGLYFSDPYTFFESVNFIKNNKDKSRLLAENGYNYVQNNYKWSDISKKYKKLVIENAN